MSNRPHYFVCAVGLLMALMLVVFSCESQAGHRRARNNYIHYRAPLDSLAVVLWDLGQREIVCNDVTLHIRRPVYTNLHGTTVSVRCYVSYTVAEDYNIRFRLDPDYSVLYQKAFEKAIQSRKAELDRQRAQQDSLHRSGTQILVRSLEECTDD